MADSQRFLPLSSSPSPSPSPLPFIQPRRPSLDPNREILATRGQRFLSFLPVGQDADACLHFGDATGRPGFLKRGMRLIGDSNPKYQWHRYYKTPGALKGYYERNNSLISQYLYIDRLLDSSLPYSLIEEYNETLHLTACNGRADLSLTHREPSPNDSSNHKSTKIKRTPRNLYRIPDETSPLLESASVEPDVEAQAQHEPVHDVSERVINLAIRVNFIANVLLLISKIVVMSLTSSLSVLASLVDAVLDFLSTAIIWTTATLIRRQDPHRYPISRRRLEPLSVLIFSVIMITSFFQVALSSANRLVSSDHTIVELSVPSIAIMGGTVLVKFGCWLWCRSIPNSSVQALAQDAMTDIVFNTFSIIFPLVGTLAKLWFLDPLGGLLLSLYIMWNWGRTAGEYIRRLTGAAASPTDSSLLLYMTMRFSKVIQKIQDVKAYYAGDKLNVEVDVVLDEMTSLRDGHDVGESLQYMLESVPTVDRAFVHLDYDPWNLPSHMNQQE